MKIIAVLFFVLAALLAFCEAQGYGRGNGGYGQMRGGPGMGYGQQGGYGRMGGYGYGQPNNFLGGGMMGGRGGYRG